MRTIKYQGVEVTELISAYKKNREDVLYKYVDFLDSLCKWYDEKGYLTSKQFDYLESYVESYCS